MLRAVPARLMRWLDLLISIVDRRGWRSRPCPACEAADPQRRAEVPLLRHMARMETGRPRSPGAPRPARNLVGRALSLGALVDLVAMADREYYCQDCETAHAASLWYVHQVNNNYGPPMADYLCGTAYVRLPHIEQRGWALLI